MNKTRENFTDNMLIPTNTLDTISPHYKGDIILFSKVCLYDPLKEETTIYGQYKIKFDSIVIENITFNLVFCDSRDDFYIKIKGYVSILKSITFITGKNTPIQLENIYLYFPFENCDLKLHSTSAIISTFCKNYSHRLDEWIQYNLKLGFSGIVIFNNDANKLIDEPNEIDNIIQKNSTEEICKKYKGRVWMVDFPYSPLDGNHYNTIQRISLHIGVNAFRSKCRSIALIDADEFIHLPKNKNTNIEDFLQKYSTITMKSNILTNKNDDDILNNNILKLAKYIGEDKYTKTILDTDKINENEFIVTMHNHHSEQVMNKEDIIHYHCWMNKRYKYNTSMPSIDLLAV
jgi:hypothetical protein